MSVSLAILADSFTVMALPFAIVGAIGGGLFVKSRIPKSCRNFVLMLLLHFHSILMTKLPSRT